MFVSHLNALDREEARMRSLRGASLPGRRALSPPPQQHEVASEGDSEPPLPWRSDPAGTLGSQVAGPRRRPAPWRCVARDLSCGGEVSHRTEVAYQTEPLRYAVRGMHYAGSPGLLGRAVGGARGEGQTEGRTSFRIPD